VQNKRIRALRKQEKKDAASLAGAAAEPADEKPAVFSCFFAGTAAIEPADASQLPDNIAELPDNSDAEERPAKCRADAFAPLRAPLANHRVDGYDIWHVPAESADDRPYELCFLASVDHDSLLASLAGTPVRHPS